MKCIAKIYVSKRIEKHGFWGNVLDVIHRLGKLQDEAGTQEIKSLAGMEVSLAVTRGQWRKCELDNTQHLGGQSPLSITSVSSTLPTFHSSQPIDKSWGISVPTLSTKLFQYSSRGKNSHNTTKYLETSRDSLVYFRNKTLIHNSIWKQKHNFCLGKFTL